ncbi:MAG: DUF4340 domain-containing protein [Deltaproteobacteria bacterium]|nr:DUF4340 domain-containing protein [Deltaproteobacteria bacterium]
MRIKKEIIILIVIIIALSIYLTLRSRDLTRYDLPKIPEVPSKEISKIEVIRKASSFILEKKGDEWVIPPKAYPADMIIVNNMLEALEELTITTLVSESKSFDRYGLDEDNRVSVKAWSDGSLKYDFDIGKEGPSSRLTYIKLAGDHRVFHAREDFRWKFDQKIDKLRDPEVLSFDQEKINRIEITQKGKTLVLSREQGAAPETSGEKGIEDKKGTEDKVIWVGENGQEANQETIMDILRRLSSLSCDRYIEDRDKDDFTDPIIFFRLTGDREYTLSIFEKTGKDIEMFPAISSGNKYSFMLSDENVEKLTKDPFEKEVADEPGK